MESRQAKSHRRDIIRYAVWKNRTLVTFRVRGSALLARRGGEIRKDRFWKIKVNIGVLWVNKNKCSISNSVFIFLRIPSGATSFWVSTSVWESLLNAKNVHFFPYFYMSLAWASHAHDEKSMFLIIFSSFSAMRLPVKIHNIHRQKIKTNLLR